MAAAVGVDQGLVVLQGLRIAQHGGMKRLPHQRHDARVVFDQLVFGGQPQLLQDPERRGPQQGRKPAVEGAYLHGAALLQQLLVQPLQGGGVLLRLVGWHAAQLQLGLQIGQRLARKGLQPLLQARAHFGCGFLGEGDGQNLLGRCACEQGAHDARYQHPGFACASAGFYHGGLRRLAGQRVKAGAVCQLAVDAVGGGVVRAHAVVSRKSRRHRPRAAQ